MVKIIRLGPACERPGPTGTTEMSGNRTFGAFRFELPRFDGDAELAHVDKSESRIIGHSDTGIRRFAPTEAAFLTVRHLADQDYKCVLQAVLEL